MKDRLDEDRVIELANRIGRSCVGYTHGEMAAATALVVETIISDAPLDLRSGVRREILSIIEEACSEPH